MRIFKSLISVLLSIIIILAFYYESRAGFRGANAERSIRLPVIMYHQICRDESKKNKYTVSAKQLEKDLCFIRDSGYKTVGVEDICRYVCGECDLPEKCVMLTFDDGFRTGYTILYPLLRKYEMKAVISPVGIFTEIYTENEDRNDEYAYLNEDEIRMLSLSKEIEIENHSFNMHSCKSKERKGINKIYGENTDDYEKLLTEDLGKMQNYLFSLTGKFPLAMTYPYGECCDDTLRICKKLGFKVTFTCYEKVNTITRYRRESLDNLGRFNRSGIAEREEFFKKLFRNP